MGTPTTIVSALIPLDDVNLFREAIGDNGAGAWAIMYSESRDGLVKVEGYLAPECTERFTLLVERFARCGSPI